MKIPSVSGGCEWQGFLKMINSKHEQGMRLKKNIIKIFASIHEANILWKQRFSRMTVILNEKISWWEFQG